jgi:hypothetical protein
MGILGPRINPGGNLFERGAFWIFKLFQIFFLWHLIQLVMNTISGTHIFIMACIVVAYLAIDHLKKRRARRPQNQP